ncbi:HNH endonuclease [Nodosilinea sp. LEGE 07088]|uniref:HNH endonuclease n=1 Tax=Nodosilinea sp. LEGE 07088 TaxID=2777968 RepID=UPI0018811C22|nr:HNH endonuclease [Nodosilinea sp. LEGE 07088]MBE9137683.1 HNH endonuclease [Nodosilinea sp. LEGE 07088]
MSIQQQTPQPLVLQHQVVVFSKNYLPLMRINIRRAIALLVTGQAEAIALHGAQQWQVRSPNLVLQVSEHIRLTSGDRERHWKVPPVSRREVFRRDQYRCQYCGSPRRLTIDHVIPHSKGGTHTWDNVVAACERCNTTKGDRLLPDTHLVLKTKPKAPMHPVMAFADQFWSEHPPD